ncbi:hypothetical protein [Streptomyces sp. NBC_01803]|uniref:hypothetical protein n=1 Tax=Streptomyces sp. NBC_01803 TaxID=2975946 RepID=UPI002DDA911D|nr:hypothetical protein [Streptomyces sp. NBC_01803]WSA43378.1 hypothetical protein OIE51_03715 [Streptomyces sp. NBC_01803]
MGKRDQRPPEDADRDGGRDRDRDEDDVDPRDELLATIVLIDKDHPRIALDNIRHLR